MASIWSPGARPALLPHDKGRSRVHGFEVLDVQIVHAYFYGKVLFEERHQLDRK